MKGECELKTKDLNYFGSDPGAVKFGNFINYYSFHDVGQRIKNLHPKMFPKPICNELFCLDIGCNTGDLTKELNLYLKSIYPGCNIHMLAVDIDATLIQRGCECNNDPNISFLTSNIMTEIDRDVIKKYLDTHGRKTFDITFCFSVTMWIHLNNGDDGLKEFLRFVKSISKSITIEPQPWNCYRNAQRRLKKSGKTFELYESLQIRSDVELVIENILTENTHRKTYESPNSLWNRKIQSFICTE